MKKFLAIARREWLSYFLSPLGYIVIAVFWLMNGFIFLLIVSFLSQPGGHSMQPMALIFTNTYFWLFLLIATPALTMRLISEERKSGSIEVLLTSPVSEWTIVVAKFCAAWVFYCVLWIPIVVYALILKSLSPVDFRIVASGLLGVLLLGAYFLAVGTFASSLSKNQIVSAMLAFTILILVFSAGLLETLANDPKWRDALGYFNLWEHMEEFARGVVDTRRVVYYLSSAALFLFLAQAALGVKKGQ
jgi:ABC-2 type transport system permease protein